MAYTLDVELMNWFSYWDAWCEWAHSQPSPLKHPIKYLKWYFGEPDFDKWRKEINK